MLGVKIAEHVVFRGGLSGQVVYWFYFSLREKGRDKLTRMYVTLETAGFTWGREILWNAMNLFLFVLRPAHSALCSLLASTNEKGRCSAEA